VLLQWTHLEMRRFHAIPSELLESCWDARRGHAPCGEMVPLEWGLDATYFRSPEERPYADRLRRLAIRPNARVGAELLCLNRPLVPFDWGVAQTCAKADFGTFPPSGDLPDPAGGQVSLDSIWAAREGSLADAAGDPGRLLIEVRKEAKHVRRAREFVVYHQFEYHDQLSDAQQRLYPAIPPWWTDVFVFPNCLVPLPPVFTYLARHFLPGVRDTPVGNFYEVVLETEWTALVFARWCSDIPQRGIMWSLPPRLRRNVTQIGVGPLLDGSRYSRAHAEQWLREDDAHPWAENSQAHMVRGPDGRGASAIIEQRQQFVREYSAFRVMARPAWPMGRWSVPRIGDQPGALSRVPDLRQESEGLENPPKNQAARPDLVLTSEVMALVRDAVSGVTALPGSSTAPSADPRVGDPKIWHTDRVGTTEDLPVRELSPVGPSGSAERMPHDEEQEEILATGYVPLRGSPFRLAPVLVPGEIPASLQGKLRSSGVFHLVEHYAQ
jgi:hypothetical protein